LGQANGFLRELEKSEQGNALIEWGRKTLQEAHSNPESLQGCLAVEICGDDIRYDSNKIQQPTTADSLVLGFHNMCMMAEKQVNSYSLAKDSFAHKQFVDV